MGSGGCGGGLGVEDRILLFLTILGVGGLGIVAGVECGHGGWEGQRRLMVS